MRQKAGERRRGRGWRIRESAQCSPMGCMVSGSKIRSMTTDAASLKGGVHISPLLSCNGGREREEAGR
jgi:hypothetical protein